jgi:hypothetical protein
MSIIDHNSTSRDERLHERGVHNHAKSEHGDLARLERQLAEAQARDRLRGEALEKAKSSVWEALSHIENSQHKSLAHLHALLTKADEAISPALAGTSPAAAALLAQGEALRELVARIEIDGFHIKDSQAFKDARAALAPGEETGAKNPCMAAAEDWCTRPTGHDGKHRGNSGFSWSLLESPSGD